MFDRGATAMSSDDDQEEEELLQRALEEQSHRNTQYRRPPNYPPPVVALAGLGPPSRNPPALNQPPQRPPPPMRRQGPAPPVEEDEESDVELLSLSSEDEDAPPSRRSSVQPPTVSKKQEEASDLEWDDSEDPACWKHVDEMELARRVREMRETKSAPVANQAHLRRVPTYSRKASTVAEGFQSADDFMDPLGLGMIDIKTLTLITDKGDRGGNKKIPNPKDDELLRDNAFREKILYHSQNFDPKMFLCRIHQNTSSVGLETGEQNLKLDLQSRKQQLKKLVKENFDCFISCKNTIDDIHSKLKQIEMDPDGAGTINLCNSIREVDRVANLAFGPLFERQVQAERIRSAQGMLQRFRTLFNLPSAIRANIVKGEYELAVREYKKAKSIVLPSHVGILKRVLEEVEKIVFDFKAKLYKSMEDPHVELSQLENTVCLLRELEPDSDPLWHYLHIQSDRIRNLLEGCSMEHDARLQALQGRVLEKVQSDARWNQLQRESNKTSEVDFNLLLGEQDREQSEMQKESAKEMDALLSRLIRRLTSVIVQHVPSFWRFTLAVFNGRFAKVGITSGPMDSAPRYKLSTPSQHPFEEKGTDVKYTEHSLDEVVAMVMETISLYETKVLSAFSTLTESNVVRPYMREAVGEVFRACLSLGSKDSAPFSAVQELFALRSEITQKFVIRLCSYMKTAALDIVNEEDWAPVSAIELGNSQFVISTLPLRFSEMLVSSMDHMNEMLEKLRMEASEAQDKSIQVRQMQESVRSNFFGCFLLLKESLEKIATTISQSQEPSETEADGAMQLANNFTGLQAGVAITNPHQKLLMVLSNAGYCKNTLLPELSSKYRNIWVSAGGLKAMEDDASSSENSVRESLSALEQLILDHYTSAKGFLIGTAAAAFLLDDSVQWGAAPPVKGIRDAAIELLYPLIAVHAEVYSGAKLYLEKAVNILVETLMDALLSIGGENQTKALRFLDLNGYCQLMLEIEYLQTVLNAYLTEAAHQSLRSFREMLRQKLFDSMKEEAAFGHKRSTRGGEDMSSMADDRMQNPPMSIDELLVIERQIFAEFLQVEQKRTRMNTVCFMDVQSLSESGSDVGRQWALAGGSSFMGSHLHQRTQSSSTHSLPRHVRDVSNSSFSDSESGKPFLGLPPLSPFNQSGGYTSSDVGSEGGGSEHRIRGLSNGDRYKSNFESKRASKRTAFGNSDDDLR